MAASNTTKERFKMRLRNVPKTMRHKRRAYKMRDREVFQVIIDSLRHAVIILKNVKEKEIVKTDDADNSSYV